MSATTGEGVEPWRDWLVEVATHGARARVTRHARPASIELLERRLEAGERYFAAEAERLARLCRTMAERFARGGRLLAVGGSPQAWSDAHHVAVEFVHPVIVGKRALPALAVEPGAVDAARGATTTW